ncbi:MAG: 50S ribosomal protein L29 [Verrucomicrobia bacterium]|nr:50S ribosomal protein L29 [Verrucomicrobiota bacterium]
MTAKELRDLSVEDLQKKEAQLKMDNFNMRIQQQLNQLEKPHRLRANRRDIARIKTILRQRELAAAK